MAGKTIPSLQEIYSKAEKRDRTVFVDLRIYYPVHELTREVLSLIESDLKLKRLTLDDISYDANHKHSFWTKTIEEKSDEQLQPDEIQIRDAAFVTILNYKSQHARWCCFSSFFDYLGL